MSVYHSLTQPLDIGKICFAVVRLIILTLVDTNSGSNPSTDSEYIALGEEIKGRLLKGRVCAEVSLLKASRGNGPSHWEDAPND